MARTYRAEPSHGAWLRKPAHMRAKKELLRAEEEGVLKNRRPIPPSDWDDKVVSHHRGQKWSKNEHHD